MLYVALVWFLFFSLMNGLKNTVFVTPNVRNKSSRILPTEMPMMVEVSLVENIFKNELSKKFNRTFTDKKKMKVVSSSNNTSLFLNLAQLLNNDIEVIMFAIRKIEISEDLKPGMKKTCK